MFVKDPNVVYFYLPEDAYGEFSNVIPSTFKADLKEYKSNEHYFQSKKYQGTDKENYII